MSRKGKRGGDRTTVASVGLLLSAMLVMLAAEYRAAHPADGPHCPPRPRQARPAAFHFRPGFAQHSSWIEFRVPERDATWFTLCLDDRLWEAGIGQTPENGIVRVSVNTTFVDAEWLLGRLRDFEQESRWELGYTTYTIENRRSG